jgi:hypothetical protein
VRTGVTLIQENKGLPVVLHKLLSTLKRLDDVLLRRSAMHVQVDKRRSQPLADKTDKVGFAYVCIHPSL